MHVSALWHVLVEGLNGIWPPSRTTLGGISLGDVWPCSALRTSITSTKSFSEGDDLVPFHKLTGWTTYSLLEPLQTILKWEFDGLEDLTGLPEYRNGQSAIFVSLITISFPRRENTSSSRGLYTYTHIVGHQAVCL